MPLSKAVLYILLDINSQTQTMVGKARKRVVKEGKCNHYICGDTFRLSFHLLCLLDTCFVSASDTLGSLDSCRAVSDVHLALALEGADTYTNK